VRLPKRKHADRGYLTHAQVAALADAVDRNATVVRFLAYTGLRWGEMAALRVQDFDMLRRRVNVDGLPEGRRVVPWITPHDLRHTAASLAVSAGANVKAVQRMLGHAKASMTLDVYADLFDADLDDVATNLDVAIRSAAYPLRTGNDTAKA
jgi:integrase